MVIRPPHGGPRARADSAIHRRALGHELQKMAAAADKDSLCSQEQLQGRIIPNCTIPIVGVTPEAWASGGACVGDYFPAIHMSLLHGVNGKVHVGAAIS